MKDIWTPPSAEVKDVGLSDNPDAAEVRRRHINHELAVKGIGTLYYLAAAAIIFFALYATYEDGLEETLREFWVPAIFLGVSGLVLATGFGLRRLTPWGRMICGLVSLLGLFKFPVGTAINGFILYLLFSRKGKTVFSEEYHRIIAETPAVRSRVSIVIWLVLALIVAFLAIMIFTFIPHGRIVH